MQGCYPLRHILLSPAGNHGKESGFLHVQVSPREHTCTELLIGSALHSLQPNFFGYLHPDDAAIQLGNNIPIVPAYGGKNEVRMLNTPPETVPLDRTNGATQTAEMVHGHRSHGALTGWPLKWI